MTFPTPYTVIRLPHQAGTADALGVAPPTFGAAVTVDAIGWAPRSKEYVGDIATIETTDLDLYLPPAAVSLQDRFIVDGVTYEVVGVADWNHGFHQWQPGIAVGLRRIEA